jgi:hypothetical protein
MNDNFVHEQVKIKLSSENTCYRSVQIFVFARFLSKNVRITIKVEMEI